MIFDSLEYNKPLVTRAYLDKKTLELKLWVAGSYSLAILLIILIGRYVPA